MPDTALRAAKKDLRTRMLALRADVARTHPDAATALCHNFLSNIDLPSHTVISGYIALRDEIDPAPLMAALAAKGCMLALPVVMGHGTNLVFRTYTLDAALIPGALGVPEPSPDATVVTPDMLIVPLLAFDRIGHRLGYGAGYYDRTLLTLRAHKNIIAVGIGYGEQEVTTVPHGLHDAPLDKIVTNKEFIAP